MLFRLFILALAVLRCEASAPVSIQANRVPPSVQAIQGTGLENLFRLGDRVYSGGSPGTDQAFAELKKLGVDTILSVDGSKPDVETARKHGLRYIHIPMGYDGTSVSDAYRMVKAAEVAGKGIYVHCQHGKHRGPAAAALICQGLAGWTTDEAVAWLKLAGTAEAYRGLFGNVMNFKPPTPEELKQIEPNFPEQAKVLEIVESMVEIDRRWEHLKQIKKANFAIPAEHPDLVPEKEAALLAEAYRELARTADVKEYNQEFETLLAQAERDAWDLQKFLANEAGIPDRAKPEAARLWTRVGKACAACHEKYRN